MRAGVKPDGAALSLVVSVTDYASNVVEVPATLACTFGSLRNAVNKAVPCGFAVREGGLVPEPFSFYIDDAPELFQGPCDEWYVADVCFEQISAQLKAIEQGTTAASTKAAAAAAAAWAPGRITLRMAAMGALGPRRRICVLFPDESDSALDQLKSVDAKLRDAASDVLGYALFGAQGGAANRAAALVVCLASLEKRMKRNDFDREHIVAVAGLGSAGEIAALVFAGSLTLEDALHLIEARHAALEVVGNSALAATSVIGVELTVVEKLLPEGLAVTHHLFGRGFVVAGGTAELDAFEAAVGACSAQTQRLAAPYFGAHSPQAFAAVGAFSAAVEAADVSDARYDVYSSSSSEDDDAPCRDASDLARRVSASLDGPVRWQQTCERLVRDGATHFVEASHSTHLRAFMGQIDPAAVFL
ncbi:acyl transferase/acyl hydrolase/lysophospholipase [Pelagophyceae sp. CCMP2097]|nr:acyl transferase/acyl hydrolase/lysophospholipase [Pelagophyceae sp. CCMP2097]